MKKTTTLKAALVIFTLTALVVLPPVAEAVPIVSATAEATLGSDSPISDSDSGATAASASVVEPGNDPEYAGRGASDSTGRLAASANFFGASGTFATISAGATWTDTFEGIAGTQALFDFFIPGAGIGFSANNVPGLSGEFMVEILFNGISVFNSYTSVETDSNFPSMEGDFILTQEDTILTADFAMDINGFGAGYQFNPFSGSLDLTAIDGTNTITYSMFATVDGLIGETSAISSIGDPLNLSSQTGGVTLTVGGSPAPVPEPATMLLVGAGLIGIAGARRKLKAA